MSDIDLTTTRDPLPGQKVRGAPGEQEPDAGDLRRLGEEGGPIGLRVGRDPSNLGDAVPDSGDVTYPGPLDEPKSI